MKSGNLVVAALLILAVLLFAGCTGSPQEDNSSDTEPGSTTVPMQETVDTVLEDDGDEPVDIEDVSFHLIDENDAVEIGEMI